MANWQNFKLCQFFFSPLILKLNYFGLKEKFYFWFIFESAVNCTGIIGGWSKILRVENVLVNVMIVQYAFIQVSEMFLQIS